jgi:hypothetical protein
MVAGIEFNTGATSRRGMLDLHRNSEIDSYVTPISIVKARLIVALG